MNLRNKEILHPVLYFRYAAKLQAKDVLKNIQVIAKIVRDNYYT